jgi:hypothetical protein
MKSNRCFTVTGVSEELILVSPDDDVLQKIIG